MSVLVAVFAVLSSRVYVQAETSETPPRVASGGHASKTALSFDVPSEEGWHGIKGPCKSYETATSICFSDNDKSKNYQDNMECEFAYVGDATLTWEEFDIEDRYNHYGDDSYYYDCTGADFIIVDDTVFCGVENPKMMYSSLFEKSGVGNYFRPSTTTFDVTGVTRFKFGTDSSGTYKGFSICAPKPQDPIPAPVDPTPSPVDPTPAPVASSATDGSIEQEQCVYVRHANDNLCECVLPDDACLAGELCARDDTCKCVNVRHANDNTCECVLPDDACLADELCARDDTCTTGGSSEFDHIVDMATLQAHCRANEDNCISCNGVWSDWLGKCRNGKMKPQALSKCHSFRRNATLCSYLKCTPRLKKNGKKKCKGGDKPDNKITLKNE